MASQRRVYGYSGVDKNKAKQNRVTGSGRMKKKEKYGIYRELDRSISVHQ